MLHYIISVYRSGFLTFRAKAEPPFLDFQFVSYCRVRVVFVCLCSLGWDEGYLNQHLHIDCMKSFVTGCWRAQGRARPEKRRVEMCCYPSQELGCPKLRQVFVIAFLLCPSLPLARRALPLLARTLLGDSRLRQPHQASGTTSRAAGARSGPKQLCVRGRGAETVHLTASGARSHHLCSSCVVMTIRALPVKRMASLAQVHLSTAR